MQTEEGVKRAGWKDGSNPKEKVQKRCRRRAGARRDGFRGRAGGLASGEGGGRSIGPSSSATQTARAAREVGLQQQLDRFFSPRNAPSGPRQDLITQMLATRPDHADRSTSSCMSN